MRQHAYLAAMMGFMREHVGKHGGAPGPRSGPTVAAELLHTTVRAGEGFGEHLRGEPRAFRQRSACLALRAAGAIELSRQLEMRSGEPQPLATDVVDLGQDGSDRARVAARGLGVPGVGIEMLEDELVYVVADGVGLHQDVSNWTKASFNRCCIASPQSRGFRWP